MNKFIITLVIFWVIYKAVQQGLAELRRRMEEMTGEKRMQPPLAPTRTVTHRVTTRQPVSSSAHRPGATTTDESAIPRTESELEHWFREALERKQALEHADETVELFRVETPPPPATQPSAMQPSTPRPQPARRQPRQRQAEPRVVVHEQRRRAERPREPMAVTPPMERSQARALEPTRARRRRVRERSDAAGPPHFLAGLDQRDIRKGIVLAEILGTPKGLRDIDTHVI
jgi:hypothetical protein